MRNMSACPCSGPNKEVLLLERRDPARLCWKIQTGSIAMYFRSFSEANAYCKRNYYDLHGKRLQTV